MEDIAWRIGRLWRISKLKNHCVRRDVLPHQRNLKTGATKGLQDAAADVLDTGMSAPKNYFATFISAWMAWH